MQHIHNTCGQKTEDQHFCNSSDPKILYSCTLQILERKSIQNNPVYDHVLLYMPGCSFGPCFQESFKNTFFITELQKCIKNYRSYYNHIYVLILYNFLQHIGIDTIANPHIHMYFPNLLYQHIQLQRYVKKVRETCHTHEPKKGTEIVLPHIPDRHKKSS